MGCKDKDDDGDGFTPVYEDFTVMSFNIRTFTIDDKGTEFWENRKEFLISTIFKYSPDIIGFQEVRDLMQYDYLKEAMVGYGWCGNSNYYTSDIPGIELAAETNAVFYKKSRFELVSWETKWLSETPDVLSKSWDTNYRTYTKAVLTDKLSGKNVNFVNTHFNPGSEWSMEEMSKRYSAMAEEDGEPYIFTGDFNNQEGSPYYAIMTAGVLADTKYLTDDSDTGGTSHGFSGVPRRPNPIDFIFVTESLFEVKSYKIIRDASEEGYFPSDHFPVKAVLRLKP